MSRLNTVDNPLISVFIIDHLWWTETKRKSAQLAQYSSTEQYYYAGFMYYRFDNYNASGFLVVLYIAFLIIVLYTKINIGSVSKLAYNTHTPAKKCHTY